MILSYITWDANPVFFSIGSFQVRWYGLCWALGFLFGYLLLGRVYKREKMSSESLDRVLMYMLISTVIGARIGHCYFYEPEFYLSHPLNVLKIWEGGLSSHGGGIGILIGLFFYAQKEKKTYLWIMDRIVIPVCLVGSFIRFGNLMNSEIYGTPTSLPWGFKFMRGYEQFCGTFDNYFECTAQNCCPPDQWLPCHPTALYEIASLLLMLGVLLWLYFKKDMAFKYPGFMFGLFLIVIFGCRICIEFLKNVQVDFERNMLFDMGQWLSMPFVVAGIVLVVMSLVKANKKNELTKQTV